MTVRAWCVSAILASSAVTGCASDGADHAAASGAASSTGLGGAGGSGGTGGFSGAPSGFGGTSHDPCGKLCTKFEALGCGLAGCPKSCAGWIEHAGDCADEMAAEIDCIADSTTACGQDVCHAEYAKLDACAAGEDCFVESCKTTVDSADTTCECRTGCSTGAIRVLCETKHEQKTSCQCFVGGSVVGECVGDAADCSASHGCCTEYF